IYTVNEVEVDLADGFTVLEPAELGPDGTPAVETPAVVAGRAPRPAEDPAGTAEALVSAVRGQLSALLAITPTGQKSVQELASARRTAGRLLRVLRVLRDDLGGQHVELSQLADQLHGEASVVDGLPELPSW